MRPKGSVRGFRPMTVAVSQLIHEASCWGRGSRWIRSYVAANLADAFVTWCSIHGMDQDQVLARVAAFKAVRGSPLADREFLRSIGIKDRVAARSAAKPKGTKR